MFISARVCGMEILPDWARKNTNGQCFYSGFLAPDTPYAVLPWG